MNVGLGTADIILEFLKHTGAIRRAGLYRDNYFTSLFVEVTRMIAHRFFATLIDFQPHLGDNLANIVSLNRKTGARFFQLGNGHGVNSISNVNDGGWRRPEHRLCR